MKMTIDRIEGTVAVLISRGEKPVRVNVPVELLPPGCREGDILTIRIERDGPATKAAQEQVVTRVEHLKNKR
jgi:hypothetical protein